jgi:hypothetical protein
MRFVFDGEKRYDDDVSLMLAAYWVKKPWALLQ